MSTCIVSAALLALGCGDDSGDGGTEVESGGTAGSGDAHASAAGEPGAAQNEGGTRSSDAGGADSGGQPATEGGEGGEGGVGTTPVGNAGQPGTGGSPSGQAGAAGNPAEASGGDTSCEEGTLDCTCYGNGTCNEGLRCDSGRCIACPQGEVGCPCYGNNTCNEGLTCNGAQCLDTGTGGAGGGGNTGTGGGTGGGLASTGGTGGAGAGSCPEGSVGCPCYGNQTCDSGLDCDTETCVVPEFCSPETVLDDMEDGDGAICLNAGRDGGWYVVKGPTGSTEPAPDTMLVAWDLGSYSRSGSDFGMRFAGTGFGDTDDDWALLGVSVNDQNVYNATVHTGVAFWARADTPMTLRVNLTTTASRSTADGGSCVQDAAGLCADHWGTYVDVTTTWSEFSVHFDYLKQVGWGKAVTLDLTELWTIEFHYAGDGVDNSGATDVAFDNPDTFALYVDDVRFW